MSNVCDKCEPPNEGESVYCERHKCHKTQFLWRKCKEQGAFWRQWEKGRGPGQNGTSQALPKKKGGCKGKASKLTGSINGDGPGSQLAGIFSKAGVSSCHACLSLAQQMNIWGVSGCEERFDDIVNQIMPRAKQWLAKNKKWVHKLLATTHVEDFTLRLGIQQKVRQAIKLAAIEKTKVDKLVVVSCHFNPAGFQRPRDNFARFAEGIRAAGVPLFTVELAYDDDPFMLDGPGLQVRGSRDKHLLWQKERLLNMAFAQLPDADAFAWIDGDILFDNPKWPEQTLEALEKRPVVQLFENATMLNEDGSTKMKRKSCGWYYQQDRAVFADLSVAHPGFAWAGRADWVRRHGLYEYMVTGGGDSMMIPGFTDAYLGIFRPINENWLRHARPWVSAVSEDIRRKFGYVPGDIRHMYHGSWKSRRYRTRWEWLIEHDFTPELDITDGENGLLEWSEHALRNKPDMVESIKGYFSQRNEDE